MLGGQRPLWDAQLGAHGGVWAGTETFDIYSFYRRATFVIETSTSTRSL